VIESSFLQRHSRTILLNGVDFDGAFSISKSKILLVGAGGISSSIISILSCAGVGEIALWEGDTLEISNLQRQFIYKTSDVGKKKVNLASKFIQENNPEIIVKTYPKYLTEETTFEFEKTASNFDVIVDGTDSFYSRSICNKVSVKLKKPFFTGSCIGFEGQVCSFKGFEKQNPCYACLFGADYKTFVEAKTCANSGIFPPLPSIVGSLISQNILQFLAMGECNFQKLTLINFNLSKIYNNFREVLTKKDDECEVCGC
jgi:molybdopterin/thiamine biosynthesis adenylyltransferase